ncbi:NAD(P)/FAD-dependent oxidoreductase [Paenibacillus sp. YYML68]|uniref:phytoene desaturase family protein n=1 Tax=Paenibacillus sp. YYML68 TaxID=2909250 RepID=UPI002491ED32|nr:phytoene desaturase family protein [Paenibacillus sp. YYML68]
MSEQSNKHILVIGGGIGGLTTACMLAVYGFRVTILEQHHTLGGKLHAVQLGSSTFDFGPSTITMPWIFEEVFRKAGTSSGLEFIQLPVNSRNVFADGTTINLSADPDRMEEQLASFSRDDQLGFKRFLGEVEKMYKISEREFFTRSFAELSEFHSPSLGLSMLRVHPLTRMDAFHRRYFRDPRLLAMMNRYATYVGSSPFRAPATLSMIAYLELVRGVYYIRGGNSKLIEALERLAGELGVRVVTGAAVERIVHDGKRIRGVVAQGELWEADIVVSNCDYYTTQTLLADSLDKTDSNDAHVLRKLTRSASKPAPRPAALSSSGFLSLLSVKGDIPGLDHHTLYYPDSYGSEFTDIFEHHEWPTDPAIYICCSAVTEPERAGNGAYRNIYALVNVPAAQPAVLRGERSASSLLAADPVYGKSILDRHAAYRDKLVARLSTLWGSPDLSSRIEAEASYGPEYLERLSGSYAGALYGAASHDARSAFMRPSLKDRQLSGLYYAGGTVHPGGGTPMVTISGLRAAELIARRHRAGSL